MSVLITQIRREIGLPEDPDGWDDVRQQMEEMLRQPIDYSGLLERMRQSSQRVPAEEWAELPADLSVNLDHYLYGVPKQVEEP